MNRQQRRKAGIKTKTPTYNFTQEQLKAEIDKGIEVFKENIRDEVTNDALRVLAYVPLMILHDKYGFGKKRLQDFMCEFAEQIDCIENNYVSFEDMIKAIRDETGLEVNEYIKI